MAGAQCTVFSLVTPLNNPITRRTYPLLVVSSISTANPSKPRHRKNHLRLKILKTLRKPHPPITPSLPEEPPPLPSTPQEHDLRVEIPADGTHGENGAVIPREGDQLEKLPVSETVGVSGEYNSVAGKLSAGSILKYGAYLVGVFVFQTICSVWVLSNSNSEQKAGDSVMGNLEIDKRGKGKFLLDGNGKALRVTKGSNALYVDNQSEMKIEEIRAMAREARRIEEKKKEEEAGDPEIGDEDALSSHRLGIEKEINARLEKLQSKMNSGRGRSKASHVNQLGTSVKSRDSMNVNQGKEKLMFEKKLKYRSPSTKSTKISKGFQGRANAKKRGSAGKGTAQENGTAATNSMQTLYENKQVNHEDIETLERDSRLSLKDGGNLVEEESKPLLKNGKNLVEEMKRPNVETERGVKSNEVSNGGIQETSFERSSVEVKQSRKSRELGMQIFKGFVEDNQENSSGCEKDDLLSINRSPKDGLAEKKISAANGVKAKPANTETDVWWMNLRYVLVILMRRGLGEEGAGGLYSLKTTSQEHDQSDYSYMVAFEDQADANNFCFLLESFFEDLGDFSADAVPMSIQELQEAVKSHAKKVIVVKKRQLQLYAGQPLADVEMALCSLIEKDQNVRPIDLR